jgi:eukaryotic-like serine/threonine-protein kinase
MGDVLRGPLVLPEDLLIIPVAELPDELRQKLGDGGEEYAVTRPLARQPSKLIDAAAAQLIEQFREPQTIVQAVISYSRKNKTDPERVLEDSLPLLRQLLFSGVLLPEGNREVRRIETTYATGSLVGPFRIVRCVQVFDDSELYQARDQEKQFVALKLAREGRIASMQPRLDREVAALQRLSGIASPQLIDHGVIDNRPFLATEWISGIDAVSFSADLRQENDRDELLNLLIEIARAYVTIHSRGVIHGDIHPGNLLVGRNGSVTLIDFGLAQTTGCSLAPLLRGGVSFFMEPEYAREVLNHHNLPPASSEGEQFAVGALLYLLATGQHYMDFTLQEEDMLRQIRDAAPLPFVGRGAEPWPDLEEVLGRALAVVPEARHRDMAHFTKALTAVARPSGRPARPDARSGTRLVSEMLMHVGLDSDLYRAGLPQGPLCSVNFGGSGIAYALHRLACLRDAPHLLATADAWIMKAQAEAELEAAFYNPAMDITDATVGHVSLYHAVPGLHLVKAMIAETNGEAATRDAAARAFLASVDMPCLERDLCLGRSGIVLGSAMLLETLPDADDGLRKAVRDYGEQRLSELWAEAAEFDIVGEGRQWPNIGIAHGWAGLLYATFRWNALTRKTIPADVQERLSQLMDFARPSGRGMTWPWRQTPNDDYLVDMPGWCNGSTGIVHLACIAHRSLGDDTLIELAEAAAWHSWEAGEGPVDLCCGYAGRAYALIEMYRSTNDANWLNRARALAERAVQMAPQLRTADHPRHSLYKGELGLTLLIEDLEQPQTAVMPMFGPEGPSA